MFLLLILVCIYPSDRVSAIGLMPMSDNLHLSPLCKLSPMFRILIPVSICPGDRVFMVLMPMSDNLHISSLCKLSPLFYMLTLVSSRRLSIHGSDAVMPMSDNLHLSSLRKLNPMFCIVNSGLYLSWRSRIHGSDAYVSSYSVRISVPFAVSMSCYFYFLSKLQHSFSCHGFSFQTVSMLMSVLIQSWFCFNVEYL